MPRDADNATIPPETYDTAYLLSPSLEGYQEYLQGGLSPIKAKQLGMLGLHADATLLEIGFGRGEFLRHCAAGCREATGIDYSRDACEIARRTLAGVANARVEVADCRALPFAAESFDRVYAGDVIEHMSYRDGVRMLAEAWRVLRPGGVLLVHTSPNAVFMRGVYPLSRVLLRAIHAESVRRLDAHVATGKDVHLHEYSLGSLRRAARDAGLPGARAWIDPDLLRGGATWHTASLQRNPLVRFAAALGRFAAVRRLLGNDLYLRCEKPPSGSAGQGRP